jgi:alpha-glucoside transport system substrate-binding protein
MKKFTFALVVLALALMSVSVIAAQDDLIFPIGEGPFTWSELDRFSEMDFGGEEVVFFGPWLRSEGEAVENIVKYFNQAANANVVYIGSDSFEQQIIIDVQGGNPPNLASFPQPGLAANVASINGLVPLSDEVRQYVLENYAAGQSWVDLATYPNQEGEPEFYAIFYNVNLKSIVWYVPDEFEERGYKVPTTWDELVALSEKMAEDGTTPWCIGIGSQAATGWPATDWVEDIMLRTAGPQVYDQWVRNEIPFTDPAVKNAIELFGLFARDPRFVSGGTDAVVTTDFRDSPQGLFTTPPQCFMHRQASFIAANFPEDVEVGVDADFFYFPPINPEMGNPVLGAGTLIAITKDSPATQGFLQFLLSPLAHELWAAQGGFLTPLKTINIDSYQTDTLRKQGEILLNADVFRFDGSDLMPGAIGAGAFWTAMVDYSNGKSVDEVTEAVQKAWDDIK